MLETFGIYNAALVISVMAAFFYQRNEIRYKRKILLIISFLPLFLVSALRYKVGADFEEYSYIYKYIENYSTLFLGYEDHIEPIYYIINYSLKLLELDSQLIYVVTSFISLYFVFKSGIKIGRLDLFLLMYVLVFYLNSLNAIRQETAICILIYALICLIKEDNIKFIVYTFIAAGFHYISLAILPILLLNKIVKINKKYLFISIFVFIFLIKFSIADILISTNLLSGTKYQVYLYMDIYKKETEIGSGLGILVKYLPVILVLLVPITSFKPSILHFRNITMILNLSLLFSFAISMNFYIFHRFISLFSVSIIFSVVLLYFSNIKIKKIILLLSITSSLLFFEADIQRSDKTIEGNKAISPYTSILSDL